MPPAKLAACCGVAAIALSACGATTHNPLAGSIPPGSYHAGRASYDDPRVRHVACLRAHHLPYSEFGMTGIQVGSAPAGPTIVFAPSAGAAQAQQITAQTQGAEVIGAALVYPNNTPDSQMHVVEQCVGLKVKG